MPSNPTENIELLLRVGILLSSKLQLSELLVTIMEISSRIVNAETASLLLHDPNTDELYFDVALGLDPEVAKIRLKLGQGIAGTVAQTARPLIINDAQSDPRWSKVVDQRSGFTTRSVLAAPILLKDRMIGVVEAINSLRGGFTEEDLRLFEAFASQAAVTIENARLFSSLSEEKSKLRTVLDEMSDAAVLADGHGRILLANDAARKLFSAEGGAFKTVYEAAAGLSSAPPLADILAGEADVVDFEATRKGQKLLILSGTASRIRPGSPESQADPKTRVFVFRDVTEQRREEGLKRSFLSLISHKLKTPLTSVTGYSQVLLEELKGRASAVQLKALGTIRQQGLKLASLVEKLLNYTVLEGLDTSQLTLETFSVDEAITQTVEEMEPWLKENDGVALVEAGSRLSALGDPLLFRDALKNLIENAVKFDPKPQKRVAIWAMAGKVGEAEVHVRDNGRGIPPEEVDRIFEKFHQVESDFTGQIDGWGLGLSFVKKVAEKHGGAVRVESKLGVGTTMTLAFPAASGGAQG
ncbi:MAG: GAF domain-containing protein [Elusimicrobia bacterium]|nr:GAF domain-containing protein [Elusimicrobiota bacterium]